MVTPSSCALETMPRPLRNATTGASIISPSSRISSRAWIAPLPTKIIGVLLVATSAAASLMRSLSGCGAGKGSKTFAMPVSARCVKTSHGISSATGPRRPDSISWNARDTRIFDALGPFDEGAQCRELVRHLVQMAAAFAEEGGRHLSGETQHRLVRSERRQHRGARIEHAGAGHHAEHARAACRPRVAISHIAAGLLVARADHL